MSAWTKEKKLDTLIELITTDHWPRFYEGDDIGSPGISDVYRCACGDAGSWRDHLRQMIANEGLVEDDPGVRQ